MNLIRTWKEGSRVLVFEYKQENYHVSDFKVYSDGFPGTSLSDYTCLFPKVVNSFEELKKIVPITTLRDTIFVDEREDEDDGPINVMVGKRIFFGGVW